MSNELEGYTPVAIVLNSGLVYRSIEGRIIMSDSGVFYFPYRDMNAPKLKIAVFYPYSQIKRVEMREVSNESNS